MLRDFCTLLVLRRLAPEWIGGEVRVDVAGRQFVLADHPFGVVVREEPEEVAVVCEDPDDALAALGLPVESVDTIASGL
jgi:hypothetical protein